VTAEGRLMWGEARRGICERTWEAEVILALVA
jgi:hypothetical protein